MQGKFPVDQYFKQKKMIMAIRYRVNRVCEELLSQGMKTEEDLNG